VYLYTDGRTGSLTVTGNAWDYDSGSSNELIGSWNKTYGYGTSTGQKSYTSSGNGCTVKLYLTVTKDGDLFD
jgi:hypothetical protein